MPSKADIRRHITVLNDPKSKELEKTNASIALGTMALNGLQTCAAIRNAGGIVPLVELLKNGSDGAKRHVAQTLHALAQSKDAARAIVDCGGRGPLEALAKDQRETEKEVILGRASAQRALRLLPDTEEEEEVKAESTLESPKEQVAHPQDAFQNRTPEGSTKERAKELPEATKPCDGLAELRAELALELLPMEAPSGALSPKQVQVEVKSLESDSTEEQCKAAEQLGSWAAMSDEKRGEIEKAGGCEALVALVVNGSEDAKWHAARALRNLANHAEAKESILKADGIAVLTPLAKHGKGKVKEAASEALNLLSVDAKAKPAPVAEAEPVTTAIPTGEGTRVAMFSARFDGGAIEKTFRKVFSILLDHKYDVLMVAADAGKSFGDLTTEYLERLRSEKGTMIAVCSKHYGEMTASSYSSHEELKFALDYKSCVTVLPLQVEETYPPEPPCGPDHRFDKKNLAKGYISMVFKPSVVYLDCRADSGQLKSETDIAAKIAAELQKFRAAAIES